MTFHPFQEPDVICPKCKTRYTMDQAVRLVGMQCPQCHVRLEQMSNEWFVSEVAGAESKGGFARNPNDPIAVSELWLPASNKKDAQAVRQFISSLALPLALEYYGEGSRRVMLVRGPKSGLHYVAGQITQVWPNAYLQILDDDPVAKPVVPNNPNGPSTTQYELVLGLAEAQYLPIRIWETFLKGDPVHNLFAATLGLKENERVWMQIFAERNGRPEWLTEIQSRLKMEQQRGFVITDAGHDDSMGPNSNLAMGNTMSGIPPVSTLNVKAGIMYIVMVAIMLLAVALSLATRSWWVLLGVGALAVIIFGALMRFGQPKDDAWRHADLQLIRMKVVNEDTLIRSMIRVNVWAADQDRAQMLTQHFLRALTQFSMSGGNHFQVVPAASFAGKTWPIEAAGVDGPFWSWLTADELGGMWHPPLVDEQVSPGLVPVRGIEVRAPDPADVEGFYEIGNFYRPDGERGSVRVSESFLGKSCLLVGKPGAGKSVLMEHLVLANSCSKDRPALIVIDPHGDMVEHLMGSIDPENADRVRILDIGDTEYLYTYNPLDVQRNRWNADEASQIIIDIGSSLWADYWGPRMQVPLKRAVMALAAANAMRPGGEAFGLSLLTFILNTSHEVRKRFIETELDGSQYQDVLARYFFSDYKNLSNNLREQIIQPVISKASRFEENPLLGLFSSIDSKMDLTEIIHDRLILLVNTRMTKYGKELSGFVGSMIIDLLINEVTRQGEKALDQRIPVAFIIDEFQTFSGVHWQELLAQLRKFGGRTVLGTQSLASLRSNDPELVGQVMSGVYPLFAFGMNGEDAEYLAKYELSEKNGGPSASTLNNLDPYSAYVRMIRADGHLTRPFYFTSRPPAAMDTGLKQTVWRARAKYSAPFEETVQAAGKMLNYMDQYGGTLLSGGVTSTAGVNGSINSATSQAAAILRSNAGGNQTGAPTPMWSSLESLEEDMGIPQPGGDPNSPVRVTTHPANQPAAKPAPPTAEQQDKSIENDLSSLLDGLGGDIFSDDEE